MHCKSAVAVALLAAAPLASATGSAIIKNACSFPVYLWTVSSYSSEMRTIDSGESFTEGYMYNANGGGVSMKLATNPSTAGAITQYEYTLDSTLWYDISNINGNPFTNWGLELIPSISSCRKVACAAGVETCSQVYNTPDENWATAACDTSADTTLTLCSANPAVAVGDAKKHHHHHHHHHKHHKHHHHHHHHHAPAPVAITQLSSSLTYNNYGAPMTTLVTQVVTITAREAEPTIAAEEPLRRHINHLGSN